MERHGELLGTRCLTRLPRGDGEAHCNTNHYNIIARVRKMHCKVHYEEKKEWIPSRFESLLDPQLVLPHLYINVWHCRGRSMAPLRLKDYLQIKEEEKGISSLLRLSVLSQYDQSF